ncbi:MAG: hypothetical protein AAFQ18_10555 [Pseudomonadota bacterium]
MADWTKSIPKLKETLPRHFPKLSPEHIAEFADRIYNGSSSVEDLQILKRSDKKPEKDIENLKSAAKNLRLAAGKIDSVGLHGSTSFPEMVRDLKGVNDRVGWYPVMSAIDARAYLADHLKWLGDQLDNSAAGVAPTAPSVLVALGGDPDPGSRRGRPEETQARWTTWELYGAYLGLNGERPSVSTDWMTNTAYGPFLDLVTDVFACMDIEASPETWARTICQEENGKTL